MWEEDFLDKAYSPIPRIMVYEWTDMWLRMQGMWVSSDSKGGASGQPLISPNLDWIPVANLPSVTMLNYLLSSHDTSPSIWRLCPHFSTNEVPLQKVPSFETRWTREEVLVCKRQPCLAKRVRLKAFRSRKPKPPSVFGTQILSQLDQANLFFPLFWPHQKLLTMLASSSHRASGSWKTLIVYVGIA